MTYKRLGVIEFGKALLESGDLDPVYVMLYNAKLSERKLYRWLLAYFLFYHSGVSSYIAKMEGKAFYMRALRLAKDSKTPRGTERRHFRGQVCIECIRYFENKYPEPEQAVLRLTKLAAKDVGAIILFVKNRWPLFGPWMGFKIADILERLAIAPIKFPVETLEMYSEPTKGAALVAQRFPKLWPKLWSENQDDSPPNTRQVVEFLIKKFSKYKAPPRYERPVGVQEIETILCKWKSHVNGHYPLGKDTHEIREGLEGWGSLARKLRKYLP